MEAILIKSLIVSLFCVGLRIVSSDGMIFHFLRVPYEYLIKKEDDINNLGKVLIYLMKPIIGCTTCMASVWSIVIDYYYFENFNKWTIILIFVAACLNSIIYAAFEKLDSCSV